jgi:hypothetical protein
MPQGLIEGYASLFGVKDLSDDIVVPGAFDGSLRRRGAEGLRLLYQHDTEEPIGIFAEAFEDAVGLFIRAAINLETRRGFEAMSLLAQGALTGLSIGFNVVKAERAPPRGRLLTEIDLWEVSLVTFPMLPGAEAWPVSENPEGTLVRAFNHASRLFVQQGV